MLCLVFVHVLSFLSLPHPKPFHSITDPNQTDVMSHHFYLQKRTFPAWDWPRSHRRERTELGPARLNPTVARHEVPLVLGEVALCGRRMNRERFYVRNMVSTTARVDSKRNDTLIHLCNQ